MSRPYNYDIYVGIILTISLVLPFPISVVIAIFEILVLRNICIGEDFNDEKNE
jgi:hypothetical protein